MKFRKMMSAGALALAATGCVGQSLNLSPSALQIDGKLTVSDKYGKAMDLSGNVIIQSATMNEGIGSTDLTLDLGEQGTVALNIGMSIDDIARSALGSDGLVTKAKNGDQSLDLVVKQTGTRQESGKYQTTHSCTIVVGYDTVCREESGGQVCHGEGRERVCGPAPSHEVCRQVARTELGVIDVEVDSTTTYTDYAISLSEASGTGQMTATSSNTDSSENALDSCH